MYRQFKALALLQITGGLTEPQIDEIAVECSRHQCADDLRDTVLFREYKSRVTSPDQSAM
jgi:hypothetical protein